MRRTQYRHNRHGFTLVDLVIAAFIIGTVATFVLANFRQVGRNNLPLALQQVAGGLVETQTLGLAGRLLSPTDQTYPAGGYGVAFQDGSIESGSQFIIFGDTSPVDGAGPTIEGGERPIVGGSKVISLHLSTDSDPPADFTSPLWSDAGSSVRVAFNQGENSVYLAGQTEPSPTATHLGVELQNQDASRRGYVIISLTTGLITNGFITP